MKQWRSRIDAWDGDRLAAQELYCGGHWSVARQLSDAQSDQEFQTFVVSAGYGLVSAKTPLACYAATFALGQPDSVIAGRGKVGAEENREWWNQLCAWRPTGMNSNRSISETIKKWPRRIHFFALSPFYLDAISDDLARARKHLANSQNLIVISTGKKGYGELDGNILTASGELQPLLGGALVSLNIRLAAKIIGSIPQGKLRLDAVRKFMAELSAAVKPRKRPNRTPLSDAEVTRFILGSTKSITGTSYTGMLRVLRNSGRACEMKRFRKLFRKATCS